jgi:TatD DNase family protein
MKYIDIHSHLNFPDYDTDREAVLARMEETETGTIVVGTDFESSKRAVELAEQHENIWACIGVHPVDNPKEQFNTPLPTLPLLRGGQGWGELVKHPKVVAIGECGLDFFHVNKNEDFERQKNLFLKQVNFAIEHKKPLMIHSRDAYEELLEILEPLKREHAGALRGDVHFFAGDLKTAKRFWEIGFSTSFTGVITFARNYDEVIRHAPLEMLMSETDAPFVTPAPYRGKKNEPSYVSEVVKKIAEIRGQELETVRTALLDNACRVFGIVIR